MRRPCRSACPLGLSCLPVSLPLCPPPDAPQVRSHNEFLLGMRVTKTLAGKTVQQSGLRQLPNAFLSTIDRGSHTIHAVAPEEVLEAGDVLWFAGEHGTVQLHGAARHAVLPSFRGLPPALTNLLHSPLTHLILPSRQRRLCAIYPKHPGPSSTGRAPGVAAAQHHDHRAAPGAGHHRLRLPARRCILRAQACCTGGGRHPFRSPPPSPPSLPTSVCPCFLLSGKTIRDVHFREQFNAAGERSAAQLACACACVLGACAQGLAAPTLTIPPACPPARSRGGGAQGRADQGQARRHHDAVGRYPAAGHWRRLCAAEQGGSRPGC